MGESTEEGYRVEIKNKERVAAVLPLQEHWLSLSNLDLLLPPLHFGVFLCYGQEVNSLVDFSSTLASLKSSLAKALVTYYPFAGEVVLKSSGEPELLCNNRGVEFVAAYADVDLLELNLYDPDESVEKKLVPSKPESILCVQATELRCGGLVVGCTFDHRVADAYSANMFLVLWSEISNRRSLSIEPCFRRSLLSPRRPGLPDPSIDRLYMPISSVKMKPADNETINRMYYITAADISKMQAEAKSSKMEAFSAYLWKLIAKAAVNKKKWCRIGVVVNGRARLKQLAPSMESYGPVASATC
ncbi:uncharacterized protein A4U43_C04F15520 [Asparagus officinalis]|uniref:Uncharacterized protein n=1 Tax=Asparagus officinalis TaxID=4686 RepID=A0A5P1F1Q3_ASPOF|nr:shikimate O-hydroxycinnamoyltransferase-like [Asparagus officinalis]ONK72084.1 uncharacterized protein A4U43_C04F15520 [Asparagus officinalis]